MSEPYYEDREAGITLWNQDMLDPLPLIPADLIVTDPPYSRAGGSSSGRTSRDGQAQEMLATDQFWEHWFRAAARQMLARARPSAAAFIFCDYRTISLVERAVAVSDTGWIVTQGLVWDRQAMGLGSPFRASHELIAFARGPDFHWDGRRDLLNVLRFRWPYGEHANHPAEKPVALLAYLIEQFNQPGAVVHDPFAGSGSTLVACKQTGRCGIGVEMEECHCITAVRRLSQAVLPLEPAPLPGLDAEQQMAMGVEGE